MSKSKFLCPHCNISAIIDENSIEEGKTTLQLVNSGFVKNIYYRHIICPNPTCNMSTFWLWVKDESFSSEQNLFSKRILPSFASKPIPPCIPAQIAQDYREACKMCELSPKASATLIRRCLQGMIRDFWNVDKKNLKEAIDEIKNRIDSETWDAIESIRKIGNIGAHMERDINLIIDVEPEETKLLIELVESLFDEWYVTREKRRERNNQIKEVAKQKEDQRHLAVSPAPGTTAQE